MITLKAKLAAISKVKLEFIGLTKNKDADGNMIAILQLAAPIENVRGSQDVVIQGKNYAVAAKDVKEIKVHQRVLDKFDGCFHFDENTDTGFYEGEDLILDVAKSTLSVWLVDVPYNVSGNAFRTTARENRIAGLLGVKAEAPANTGNETKTLTPVDEPVGAAKGGKKN